MSNVTTFLLPNYCKSLLKSEALINAAFIDGVHDNQRAASLIVKNKIEDRDKAVKIYLTETELQALYEMPFTGKNDHIRDVFLIVAIPVSASVITTISMKTTLRRHGKARE